jgi:7-carboxy-7-deazaguanine synthase
MKVNEIFLSIQGETSSAGQPTVFVRFTGCNLRCTYCDTTYAYEEGETKTPEEVLASIRLFRYKRVCITGGEPLLQPRGEMQRLLDRLAEHGYEVSIETDGSVNIDKVTLRPRQRFILDMKTPGSGMSGRMDFANLKRVVPDRDEIKFVVGSREDFDWSLERIAEHGLWPEKGYRLLFSPVFGALEMKRLVEWILESGIDARFQVQLHKFVWDPAQRGV